MNLRSLLGVLLCLVMMLSTSVVALAEETAQTIPDTRLYERLVDNADLLTEEEENQLLSDLNACSEELQFDFVIVTTNSLEGKTSRDYADDFYDYGGYGYGEDADGALLLVSMEERDWYISTCGFGITALSDSRIDYIAEDFLECLRIGEYQLAFQQFISSSYYCVKDAKAGGTLLDPDVYENEYYEDDYYEFYGSDGYALEESNGLLDGIFVFGRILWSLFLALLFGFLGAFIPVGMMKSKMKSVKSQPAASSYVVQGSHQVTERRDQFLYHTVTKTAIPKNTSSSGGSRSSSSRSRAGGGVHRSSSGRSHGGRGGKF